MKKLFIIGILSVLCLTGCDQTTSTLGGGVLGAAAGAGVGSAVGGSGGALVGALIGGLGGAAIGSDIGAKNNACNQSCPPTQVVHTERVVVERPVERRVYVERPVREKTVYVDREIHHYHDDCCY